MRMLWMSVIEIEKLVLKMREREIRVYIIEGRSLVSVLERN